MFICLRTFRCDSLRRQIRTSILYPFLSSHPLELSLSCRNHQERVGVSNGNSHTSSRKSVPQFGQLERPIRRWVRPWMIPFHERTIQMTSKEGGRARRNYYDDEGTLSTTGALVIARAINSSPVTVPRDEDCRVCGACDFAKRARNVLMQPTLRQSPKHGSAINSRECKFCFVWRCSATCGVDVRCGSSTKR